MKNISCPACRRLRSGAAKLTLSQTSRFRVHSHNCHFHFKFILKLNEAYTGMTIQVALWPRLRIINAFIQEREAELEAFSPFTCPLYEIVRDTGTTLPTDRICSPSCCDFRNDGSYTSILPMRLLGLMRS